LSELRLTGILAIRHKTARNGFLPMHFISSMRKPHCLTPTQKFRNKYVKSIDKNHLTGLRQLLLSCLLDQCSVEVNFLCTMNVTVAEL